MYLTSVPIQNGNITLRHNFYSLSCLSIIYYYIQDNHYCIKWQVRYNCLLRITGASINFRDKMGRTPLMIACLMDKIEIVKKLLAEDGLELNIQDNDGNTALMHAAMSEWKVSISPTMST